MLAEVKHVCRLQQLYSSITVQWKLQTLQNGSEQVCFFFFFFPPTSHVLFSISYIDPKAMDICQHMKVVRSSKLVKKWKNICHSLLEQISHRLFWSSQEKEETQQWSGKEGLLN